MENSSPREQTSSPSVLNGVKSRFYDFFVHSQIIGPLVLLNLKITTSYQSWEYLLKFKSQSFVCSWNYPHLSGLRQPCCLWCERKTCILFLCLLSSSPSSHSPGCFWCLKHREGRDRRRSKQQEKLIQWVLSELVFPLAAGDVQSWHFLCSFFGDLFTISGDLSHPDGILKLSFGHLVFKLPASVQRWPTAI